MADQKTRTCTCGDCRYYKKSDGYQVMGATEMGDCTYRLPIWVQNRGQVNSFPIYVNDPRASECKCFTWDK